MRKFLLLIFLLFIACGTKVNFTGNPRATVDGKVGVQPSFSEAAEFCDNRYGKRTKESESCFMDFRNFYSIKISFDFGTINAYCESHYTPNKIDKCISDLTDLFSTRGKK